MSTTLVPWFSAALQNEVENYQRFYYCKKYLLELSQDSTNEKHVLGMTGYSIKSLNKFREHRKQWNMLERKIPIKYFQAINGDIDTLLNELHKDKTEYERARNSYKPFPKYASIRLMPCIYKQLYFQEGTYEGDAIKSLINNNLHTTCYITYQDIRIIMIRNGIVYMFDNVPEICIEKNWIVPSKNRCKGVGKSYLK